MNLTHTRRHFLKLAGLGGVVFASGLPGWASAARRSASAQDFYLVQLSDTHIGFSDPAQARALGRECTLPRVGLPRGRRW